MRKSPGVTSSKARLSLTVAGYGRVLGGLARGEVIHGQLETGAGYTVMASDHARNMGEYHPPSGFWISLSGDDGDALRGHWQKLSAGCL